MSWPGGSWQTTAVYVAVIFATYVAAFWLTLVFWTARDIRQRSSSPAAQIGAPLIVLFGFLPGHWLYLIMRPRYTRAQLYARALEEEALRLELDRQVSCPSCSRTVRDDYLVCPACKAQLKQACANCSKPLANAWVACPYCATERNPASRTPEVIAGRALPDIQAEPLPQPAEPAAQPQPVPVVMTAVAAAAASDNNQAAAG